MVGFIFGGDTGETPESIKRKREIAMALLGQSRAPRTIGEGINALGDGIVANVMNRRANAGEKAGRESAHQAFGGIDFTSLFGGGGTAYPSAIAGGASPTSGAATGTAIASTPQAAEIKKGLEARGLPSHVADAFVMNFQDESGLNPGINEKNPVVPGSRGGYGLYQLTGPRRRAYEQFASQRGVDPSDTNAQLDFLMTELQGPEAKAAQAIMSAPDTGTAAQAIVNKFLRPAEEHRAARAARYARMGSADRDQLAALSAAYPSQEGQPVQVASLDPSIGLPEGGGATIRAGDYGPSSSAGNAPADGARATFGGPQLTYDDKGLRFVGEGAQRVATSQQQPQTAAAAINRIAPQEPTQQMASVQPQQKADPKAAIRDALLRQNDMMLGGSLAPHGQAPQQVADASGSFPPAPTGQPFAGQQGGDARGAMVQKLMQAAQNPWLNDNQRAMVDALLQKQMEQGDPMRQLQMQKLQQDIARGGQTSDWSKLDDNRLFNQRTGEIRDLPTNPNAPSGDLGLNPQYGLDKDGNPVLLQLGKNGKVVQAQMPDGVTLSKEPIKLDAGTHFVLLDPITRQPVGQIPKDVAGAASEGATGKAQGEASANLPVVEANANSILGMIDSLDTDPYLDSMVGPVSSRLPNVSGDAARVQSKMDQIGGQAFLQAFNSLKGGGQITEIEGQKATQAIARLNAAQNPADYRQALGELRQIVMTGVQRARQQAGGGTAGQAAPAQQPQAPAPANNGGFRIIGVE